MSILLPKYKDFQQERKIGEYTIYLPDPPNFNLIGNKNLPQEKQKFIVTPLPKGIEQWDEKARDEFEDAEWEKRRKGYWFWNNGNLEYITGKNYFYINWWHIDCGLPNFIDADRDSFYLLQHVEENNKARGLISIERRRAGKALDLTTDIPTPNGWKKMGQLEVGDKVFGSDGNPTTITFVSDTMFNNPCYKLTFSDGSEVIADEDHLWIAYDKINRGNIQKGRLDLCGPKVVTTGKMKERLKYSGTENNWSIKNCKPVKYNEKNLIIPPYILGVWLGDGSKADPSITNVDPFVIESWVKYGESIGLRYSITTDKITHNIVNKKLDNTSFELQHRPNPFCEKLKKLNVFNNKHIPECYLQSSLEDRFELLKGLMDTDGTVGAHSASCEFCTQYEHLANQMHELISSLGYKTRVTKKLNKKHNKYYFYLRFSPHGLVPFKLQRHIDKCRVTTKGGWKPDHRYIVNIEKVDSVPVKCIAVDNSDSSYLCSKSFIVTHNTWRGVSNLYETISRSPNSQGGIQSKSNTDASKVFQKLVFSWKRLPYFFKPIDVGESHPKSKLEFSEPSKRDTKHQRKNYNTVLDSVIDFENAKEEAYDGTKQRWHYVDEGGKTVDVNVNDRLNIVKECVMVGTDIVGKITMTTTVEEMEKKGGANFKLCWEGADPNKLKPNGETQNGMLRYFSPADYGLEGKDDKGIPFVDEYGYSDRARAKSFIERQRAALVSRDDIQSDRRKYPLYIYDCWVQDSRKAVYDTAKIEQQLRHNETLPASILRIGNFYRMDGSKDGPVGFNDDPNGKFKVAWMPAVEDRNKFHVRGTQKYPANIEIGCFGLDPYDNKTTVDNRKSDAAAYGFRRFNALDEFSSGCFILEYVNRPKLPEIMWEDMIMMCQFYGWEILVESNKIGTINHFRQRGYEKYLMFRPDHTQTGASVKMKEPGIPMSGQDARMSLIYATETHIIRKIGLIEREDGPPYMGFCPFDTLLTNWQEFDFDKEWTEFDSMVGAGLALIGSTNKLPSKINKKPFVMFPMYNNSGKVSKAVNPNDIISRKK